MRDNTNDTQTKLGTKKWMCNNKQAIDNHTLCHPQSLPEVVFVQHLHVCVGRIPIII